MRMSGTTTMAINPGAESTGEPTLLDQKLKGGDEADTGKMLLAAVVC
jgi:hypothetical protein